MRFKKYSPLIAAALAVALYASATSPWVDAAVSRVKTWGAETLTSSDLNAEFNNILNNGEDLGWPATKAKDLNGFELVLDADADASITADTDDRIDLRTGGFDSLQLDGTTASLVNGFTLTAKATGVAPTLGARGEANIGLGLLDSNGNEGLILGSVASAVNEATITNAATGNSPVISATGETNVSLDIQAKGTGVIQLLDGNGLEVLKTGAGTASAVNEVTVTNAATGDAPSIAATGETNVHLNLVSKGTGVVQANGATVVPTLEAEVATTSGTSVALSTTIPSWAKRVTVQFVDVSSDGTSPYTLQIGDAGGIESTGYTSQSSIISTTVSTSSTTAGFVINGQTLAASVWSGQVVLTLEDAANFTWVVGGGLGTTAGTTATTTARGSKSLSAALDRLTLTTVNGTDAYDAGAVSLLIE